MSAWGRQRPFTAILAECLLFPKADVQTAENGMKLGSANGQKRALTRVAQTSYLAAAAASEFKIGEGWVIVRPSSHRPVIFALGRFNGKIVNTRNASLH